MDEQKNTPLAYCPNCRAEVEFTTKVEQRTTELNGIDYSYPVQLAVCRNCGNEAAYAPYQSAAGESFNDAVRKQMSAISTEQIREIPKRYNIGKRPLSILLGWGELTYTRLMEGVVPNRDHSEELKRLYEDPAYYSRKLDSGKDRISDVAYRKSRKATDSLLDNDFPNAARIYEVADFFCILSKGQVSPKGLQKLTYYAHGFSFALLDKPLLTTAPHAWVAGPVYGQLWHTYKYDVIEDTYLASQNSDGDDIKGASPFTHEEEVLLHSVYEAFGRYSGPALSEMTHAEDPWRNARLRAGVADNERCNEKISLEEMRSYFTRIVERSNSKHPIRSYAREKFASISQFQPL